jgi:hypothetical protein
VLKTYSGVYVGNNLPLFSYLERSAEGGTSSPTPLKPVLQLPSSFYKKFLYFTPNVPLLLLLTIEVTGN